MAKNKIEIDVEVDDKGTTKKVALGAKKAAEGLEKTGKSARTADRNLKGAAQTSANGTKNFSKMAQGISGGLVPAYATLAAQVFAVSAAFQFLKSASEIKSLIAGQEALGATTGVAYKTITASIKEATDGQLSYAESARAAAIGTAAGLSPSQLNSLGNAAKNASFALGRDLTDSFNRLVKGVTKAEPELLDELGITLRLKDATEEYSKAINKNVDDLTQFERTQAVAANVLGQAERKFGAIQKIMDPSAASLNKFLVSFDALINTIKQAAINSLTPIFDFLSERTLALTVALGLFALPIIKSILPSFEQWGENADKTLKIQQKKLKGLDKQYDKLRSSIKNLNATQSEALDLNQKTGKEIFKTLKIDTSKTSKSGFSGADFLTGGATSKRAQANANKVLKNAEQQIKRHGVVLTGQLQGANAKQVANLRTSYNERVRIITKFEKQHASVYTRATLHVQGYVIKSKAALASLQQFTAKIGKRIAGALDTAFRLAGWIGIILLVVDGFKALYEALFPIPEEIKKSNKAIEDFTSKQKLFNEELDKMGDVRATMGLQTITERVIAAGNAFQSADLFAKFKQLEQLDPSGDKYSEALKEFEKTLKSLGAYTPEFKELTDSLDLKDVDSKTRDKMLTISNSFIATKVAAVELSDSMSAVFTELTRLAGKGITVDPTVMLRQNLEKASANLSQVIQGTEREIKELTTIATDKNVIEAQRNLDDIKNTSVNRFTNSLGMGTAATRAENKQKAIAAAQIKLDKARGKSQEDVTAETEAAAAELAKLKKEQVLINNLADAFSNIAGKLTENQQEINALRVKEATQMTVGITLAEKLANSQLKRETSQAKILAAEQAVLVAQTAATEIGKDRTNENAQARANAQASLESAETNLEIAKAQVNLENTASAIADKKLLIEREILLIKTKQLQADAQTIRLQASNKKVAAFSTDPLAAGNADRQSGRLQLLKRIRDEEAGISTMQARTAEHRFQKDEEALADLNAQIDKRRALKESLEVELELFNKIAAANVAAAQRETKMLELKKESFSLNPAAAEVNAFLLAQQAKGITYSQQQTEALYEQKVAQMALNIEIEAQQGLYSTLSTGFENAFAGIITGTMTVKEAFAGLAKSVLQYIAQMIAKMLAFRLLTSLFGGLMPGASGAGGQFTGQANFSPGAFSFRTGGMANPPAYASAGGVFSGKDGGYPAVLHGTEAVVPLPNGNSIPVELMNGGSQSNNVVVNVSVDNNGQTSQNQQADGTQGANLGKAIAAAVQQELMNQRRNGGMLSPYGAS